MTSDGSPAAWYDEDGYCLACGNGQWKLHMVECALADLRDVEGFPVYRIFPIVDANGVFVEAALLPADGRVQLRAAVLRLGAAMFDLPWRQFQATAARWRREADQIDPPNRLRAHSERSQTSEPRKSSSREPHR